MELDEQELKDGLKYIVGTWQVDYLVNAFSDDLAHIPAAEFKSGDGTDFTAIQYEFFEDHTMLMRNTANGVESKGTWEQTDRYDYHYTVGDFLKIPEGDFKEAAESLSVQDGHLVFSIAFLAVAMNKIADGVVTKDPDIGDIEMTAEDLAKLDIVGRYEVAKLFSFINDNTGFFTREEVKADCDKRLAAGEMDEGEAKEALEMFDFITEFGADHKIRTWSKIPDGVSQKELEDAKKAGHILDYKDGMFCRGEQNWKSINGKFYYDTGEHRELFGEEQSSWDEIAFDEEGLMPFMSGMGLLRKIA